eukprot:gene18699-35584_t
MAAVKKAFDLLVIGGGSGGLGMVRRAAEFGIKGAVIESGAIGGTCVNVGCVPKKVMWSCAEVMEAVHDAPDYGIDVTYNGFSWPKIKKSRDEYITRLNGMYDNNLERADVPKIVGKGVLTGNNTVE